MSVLYHVQKKALTSSLSILFVSLSFSVAAKDQSILLSTNIIDSGADHLVYCQIKNTDELADCSEIQTSEQTNTPVALAANDKNLFIANYGHPNFGRTSYVQKCDLPYAGHTNLNCQSILAIVSSAHVTGIEAVENKIYYTESYSYPGHVNFNYLRACDLIEGRQFAKCGPMHLLNSSVKNPQNGTNHKMDIKVTDNDIFVNDFYGNSLTHCSLPNEKNEMSCETEVPNLVNGKLVPELFSSVSIYGFDMNLEKNKRCEVLRDPMNSSVNVLLSCCEQTELGTKCSTVTDQGVLNPITLRLNATNSGIYVANSYSSNPMKVPDTYLSFCSFTEDGMSLDNCKYLKTDYTTVDGQKNTLFNISHIKILNHD